MADLLFDSIGFSCFAFAELAIDLLFGQTQGSPTGGQLKSDTSSYELTEYSLTKDSHWFNPQLVFKWLPFAATGTM